MRLLPDVTLVCIDCYSYGKAVSAIQKSLQQIQFEKALFLTDIAIKLDGIEVVKIPSIRSKREYSNFVIKELSKYITTTHFMVIQADGYIIDGNSWDDRYLEYDYIGASWIFDNDRQVGNGGASLRSKKLHDVLTSDPFIDVLHPEDQSICIIYKFYLEEKYGIKFAPVDLADKFSYELKEPVQSTFAFHGNFHEPFRPTIIFHRSAALGDCLILEPVLKHFYEQGYNIVLDIPRKFFDLYTQHYFPIKHISQFDKGRIPAKEIDLDMAYEVKPRQNYLKSYFEFCGVEDYKLSRPQLSPFVNDDTKLFKRYACIHIDNRDTPHRNIYGVDWSKIRKHLESLNYTVIQIGANEHEECGIQMNTPSIGFMKFVLSGCDLFIGTDSGPAGIAVAYNKKCVLFFGSVNPDYIHPDLNGVEVIQGDCSNAYCWHSKDGGTAGVKCKFEGQKEYLQCCKSTWEQVIDAINKLHE